MSSTSTGGSGRPSIRWGRRSRAQRHHALGPRRGAARQQHGAVLVGARARPPRGRRSAGRPRACRSASCSSSTTISPMSASGANTAERGPTHTRASPLRSRSHSSWRSPLAEAGVQHGDDVAEPAPGSARAACGVSAISGTSTIAAAPGGRASPRRRGGRPRSCPSRSRRGAGSARPRAAASAGRTAVERAALLSAVSGGGARELAVPSGRRSGRARRVPSARDRDQSPCPRAGAARGVPSSAAPSARASESCSAAPAGVGERPRRSARLARAGERGRSVTCSRPTRRPRPGASTRVSARAGVEQYSLGHPSARARPGRAGRRRSTASGSASRSGAARSSAASSSTTPSVRRRPNGTAATSPPRPRLVVRATGSRTGRAPRACGSAVRPARCSSRVTRASYPSASGG